MVAALSFPDYRFAPNIGSNPAVYLLENRAVDRAGHVLEAMRAHAPWHGQTIVDLGCGTGYWLPKYACTAASVIGVEPDPVLRASARRSTTSLQRTVVVAGSAEHMPLADATVDVVHARFAYFFPPGTDAGLTEVLRILRPGGHLVAVDNDYRWGEFAGLLAASATKPPAQTASAVERWWLERRATRHEVRSELRFASRAELAAVLHIEFPSSVAAQWLQRNPQATGLTYGFVVSVIQA